MSRKNCLSFRAPPLSFRAPPLSFPALSLSVRAPRLSFRAQRGISQLLGVNSARNLGLTTQRTRRIETNPSLQSRKLLSPWREQLGSSGTDSHQFVRFVCVVDLWHSAKSLNFGFFAEFREKALQCHQVSPIPAPQNRGMSMRLMKRMKQIAPRTDRGRTRLAME